MTVGSPLRMEPLESRRLLSGVPTWVRRGGGSGSDCGSSVSSLSDGSAIVAGGFTGSAVFGTSKLAASGTGDAFVAKLTPTGAYAWAVRAGGTDVVTPTGVATLADGSAIVSGRFSGTATFGSTTLTSAGSFDVFVAKTTPTGSFAWAVRAGGAGKDSGNSVAVLSDGSSLIAGDFTGSAGFGGKSLSGSGSSTPFLAKLSPAGKFSWATCPSGDFDGRALSISAFPDGSAVVTGSFGGTASFGAAQLTTAGSLFADTYVAKVDAAGGFVWASRTGGDSSDLGKAVVALPDGSSILAGDFVGTVTFGAVSLTAGGPLDNFVTKLNPNGNFVWATQAGGGGGGVAFQQVGGISASPDGSSFITGTFNDLALFGGTPLTSAGKTDVFVAKISPNGMFAWATAAGGTDGELGTGISALADGSTMVTGGFSGTAKFGGRARTSSGELDVFTARLSPNGMFTKPVIDLDGNGVTDTVWVSDSQVTAGWVYDAAGAVIQSRNLSSALHLSLEVVGDFNGDGVSDLVWRDPVGGATILALMQSWGVPISMTPLGGNTTLRIEASGDYDGDGRDDLIWRNALTGVDSMWLMNGSKVTSSKAIGGSTSLRLVATGPDYDSDGDGRTDLVWRDAGTGASTLWRMNGTAAVSTKALGGDLAWQIVGTGDFNGDGKHDLIWRHSAGTVSMWLMNDGVPLGSTVLNVVPDFVPVGTLDFDNDGRSDVVWSNGQGLTAVKFMDGLTVTKTLAIGFNIHWSWLRRPGRSAV